MVFRSARKVLTRNETDRGAILENAIVPIRFCGPDLRELRLDAAILSTTPGTRAETFYRQRGWEEFGVDKVGDLLFKITLG